jgi:gamma-glutamylcyclotransferase (GGCT)/AIG2-like uncharacterized protein YtfP
VADATPETLLFVYGTLRRDAPMHALLRGAPFVSAAELQGRLWDFGAFPGVTDSKSRRDRVQGEVYRLPAAESERDALLDSLDRYEGDAFERAERHVVDAGGDIHTAFVYLYTGSTRGARRIASGDYLEDARARRAGSIRTREKLR